MHPGRSGEGEGQAYERPPPPRSARSSLNRGIPVQPNGAELKGTWRGSFEQVYTGDSGRIHGDIVCQINDDGT